MALFTCHGQAGNQVSLYCTLQQIQHSMHTTPSLLLLLLLLLLRTLVSRILERCCLRMTFVLMSTSTNQEHTFKSSTVTGSEETRSGLTTTRYLPICLSVREMSQILLFIVLLLLLLPLLLLLLLLQTHVLKHVYSNLCVEVGVNRIPVMNICSGQPSQEWRFSYHFTPKKRAI